MKARTTLRLYLIRETDKARLFENKAGNRQWVPRSVCPRTMKLPAEPGQPPICEVEIESWWLEKNPWPESQGKLL